MELKQGSQTDFVGAWVTRGALLLISGMAAVLLWLAQEQLADLKSAIANGNKEIWTAISGVSKNQNSNAIQITQLTATIADHIAGERQTINDITGIQKDHEQRIRSIEHINPNKP